MIRSCAVRLFDADLHLPQQLPVILRERNRVLVVNDLVHSRSAIDHNGRVVEMQRINRLKKVETGY